MKPKNCIEEENKWTTTKVICGKKIDKTLKKEVAYRNPFKRKLATNNSSGTSGIYKTLRNGCYYYSSIKKISGKTYYIYSGRSFEDAKIALQNFYFKLKETYEKENDCISKK